MSTEETMISLFRGDDTTFMGEKRLRITIDTRISLIGCSAEFELCGIVKRIPDISTGTFYLYLTGEDTARMPLGFHTATLRAYDPEGRRRTVGNSIRVNITDRLDAAYSRDEEVNVHLGATVKWIDVMDKPSINGVPLEGNKTSAELNIKGVVQMELIDLPEQYTGDDLRDSINAINRCLRASMNGVLAAILLFPAMLFADGNWDNSRVTKSQGWGKMNSDTPIVTDINLEGFPLEYETVSNRAMNAIQNSGAQVMSGNLSVNGGTLSVGEGTGTLYVGGSQGGNISVGGGLSILSRPDGQPCELSFYGKNFISATMLDGETELHSDLYYTPDFTNALVGAVSKLCPNEYRFFDWEWEDGVPVTERSRVEEFQLISESGTPEYYYRLGNSETVGPFPEQQLEISWGSLGGIMSTRTPRAAVQNIMGLATVKYVEEVIGDATQRSIQFSTLSAKSGAIEESKAYTDEATNSVLELAKAYAQEQAEGATPADYDTVRSNALAGAAHATTTGNPHGTTAAQVGAYTTNQVDDLLVGKMPLRTLPKYLHAMDFSDSYPSEAEWYYSQPQDYAQCSAVRDGGVFSRNYDWKFDGAAEFVVRMAAGLGRFASVGVANCGTNLTEGIVSSGEWSKYYKCLPGRTVDGINENGVAICINVVAGTPSWGTTGDIHPLAAVRWTLDNAKNAEDAATNLAARVKFPSGWTQNFHYMTADDKATYIVENGEAHKVTGRAAMTNFPLYPSRGTGEGQERYDALMGGANITSQWWTITYAANGYRASDLPGITGDSLTQLFQYWAGHPRESHRGEVVGGNQWWQTVHTSIYDIENRALRISVQESDDFYAFQVPNRLGNAIKQKFDGSLLISDATSTRDNLGEYALAVGSSGVTATGKGSFAQGSRVVASGSHAHAEGGGAKAFGVDSHAEGGNTEAIGDLSHSEGNLAKAVGNGSHAEGYMTVSRGELSHAEGGYTQTGADTNMVSKFAHAEGQRTTANGMASHAAGFYGCTTNDYAWAWSGVVITNRVETEDEKLARTSHGDGSFTVNPQGGFAGFFVGNTSLSQKFATKLDNSGNQTLDGSLTIGGSGATLNVCDVESGPNQSGKITVGSEYGDIELYGYSHSAIKANGQYIYLKEGMGAAISDYFAMKGELEDARLNIGLGYDYDWAFYGSGVSTNGASNLRVNAVEGEEYYTYNLQKRDEAGGWETIATAYGDATTKWVSWDSFGVSAKRLASDDIALFSSDLSPSNTAFSSAVLAVSPNIDTNAFATALKAEVKSEIQTGDAIIKLEDGKPVLYVVE